MPQTPPSAAALRLDAVGKTYGRHRALIGGLGHVHHGRGRRGPRAERRGQDDAARHPVDAGAPTAGSVVCGRRAPRPLDPAPHRIGYVGHEPGLYGDLTAPENLQLFAGLYGVADAGAASRRCSPAWVWATCASGAPTRTFSRGMQQRLALARALLTEPELLLFDEPGSALDPAGAAWLARILARERAAGRLVILVTHDLDAAAAVAEHLIILRRAAGSPATSAAESGFPAPERARPLPGEDRLSPARVTPDPPCPARGGLVARGIAGKDLPSSGAAARSSTRALPGHPGGA